MRLAAPVSLGAPDDELLRKVLVKLFADRQLVVFSTDRAEGRVGVVVYPWEVSIAHTAAGDSALNHVSAPITSLTTIGNRVRVRVGPCGGCDTEKKSAFASVQR